MNRKCYSMVVARAAQLLIIRKVNLDLPVTDIAASALEALPSAERSPFIASLCQWDKLIALLAVAMEFESLA